MSTTFEASTAPRQATEKTPAQNPADAWTVHEFPRQIGFGWVKNRWLHLGVAFSVIAGLAVGITTQTMTANKLTRDKHSLQAQLADTKVKLADETAKYNTEVQAFNNEQSRANGLANQLSAANLNTTKCQAAVSGLQTVLKDSSSFLGASADGDLAMLNGDIAGMQAALDRMRSINTQTSIDAAQARSNVSACTGVSA